MPSVQSKSEPLHVDGGPAVGASSFSRQDRRVLLAAPRRDRRRRIAPLQSGLLSGHRQLILMTGERRAGKDQREATISVRNVRDHAINHRVSARTNGSWFRPTRGSSNTQRLDRGLVDADDDGVLGRRHIEPDHVGSLGDELGIVALALGFAPGKVDLLRTQEAPDILDIDIAQRSSQQWPRPAGITLGGT